MANMTPYEAILEEYPPINKVKTDTHPNHPSHLITIYPHHLLSSKNHTDIIIIKISHEEQLRIHAFITRWNIERTISERTLFQQITTRTPTTTIDLTDPASIPWLEQHVFRHQTSK
jgi:hypothetical protein